MVNHSYEEIKGTTRGKRQRQLNRLNNALTEAVTDPDPEWRQHMSNLYNALLPVVHVNGAAGSLLEAAQ
jgi:Asp-tRNA(Asn)/Glu-tRNA(Gln) amidotransferase B subunit